MPINKILLSLINFVKIDEEKCVIKMKMWWQFVMPQHLRNEKKDEENEEDFCSSNNNNCSGKIAIETYRLMEISAVEQRLNQNIKPFF